MWAAKEQALRTSVELARSLVHGEEFVEPLRAAVKQLVGADSVGVQLWSVDNGRARIEAVLAACSDLPISAAQLGAARAVSAEHPTFRSGPLGLLGSQAAFRVSDGVPLGPFWDSEVHWAMHGQFGGRYPATLNLGDKDVGGIFVGIHHTGRDCTDVELDLLSRLREPFASAWRFRQAMGRAVGRLATAGPKDLFELLTSREQEVLALVARGWTSARIGHSLGISERTVRKHLETARAKVGAENRAAAAAWRSGRRTGGSPLQQEGGLQRLAPSDDPRAAS